MTFKPGDKVRCVKAVFDPLGEEIPKRGIVGDIYTVKRYDPVWNSIQIEEMKLPNGQHPLVFPGRFVKVPNSVTYIISLMVLEMED